MTERLKNWGGQNGGGKDGSLEASNKSRLKRLQTHKIKPGFLEQVHVSWKVVILALQF